MDKRQVDLYIKSLVPEWPAEVEAMTDYARAGNFPIIGPACGNMCYLLARAINAKNIFELGSGFGYSTYWFATAIRENGGGKVHHTVWDDDLSALAKKHLTALGLNDLVEYHIAEAVGELKKADGPFDIIFNDIDKEGYPDSLPVIKDMLRSGGILIIDNMLWHGEIFDESNQQESTVGVREFTRMITTDPDWITTLVPIRDGMIVAYRR